MHCISVSRGGWGLQLTVSPSALPARSSAVNLALTYSCLILTNVFHVTVSQLRAKLRSCGVQLGFHRGGKLGSYSIEL